MIFTDDWIDDENVYSGPSREEQISNGEITPEEDGFMEGWEHAYDGNFD